MVRFTLERARRLVSSYTVVTSPEVKEKVAQRMVETGECVWHALAQVTGKDCWCTECTTHLRRLGSD